MVRKKFVLGEIECYHLEKLKTNMKAISCFLFLLIYCTSVTQAQTIEVKTIAPGVIKMTVGIPDKFSPYNLCTEKPRVEELKALNSKDLPFSLKDVKVEVNERGV